MTDAIYVDPRLAALYDALNPWGADTDFYLKLAPAHPSRILDVGCGTGLLTCAFAQGGHAVTGVDPASAMLDAARTRPWGDRVTWINEILGRASLAGPFDLTVMTGHVFQVFLTDEETLQTLACIRRLTPPGGRLAFETRNPAREVWRTWTPEASRRVVALEGTGALETWHAVTNVDGDRVTFGSFYRIGADLLTSSSTLRFPDQAKIEALLGEAGFGATTWQGDWTGAPVEPGSAELIVVAT